MRVSTERVSLIWSAPFWIAAIWDWIIGFGLLGILRSNLSDAVSATGVKRNPSLGLNCSEELIESFLVFFLRRGGAIGPMVVLRLSVVFEWVSFVLAMTSGSKERSLALDRTKMYLICRKLVLTVK